jgi:hypothetical protein
MNSSNNSHNTQVSSLQREICWQFRDQLYACLEQNNEQLEECPIEHKRLVDACPPSWTKRFINKRKYDLQKSNQSYFEERKEGDVLNEFQQLREKRNK